MKTDVVKNVVTIKNIRCEMKDGLGSGQKTWSQCMGLRK